MNGFEEWERFMEFFDSCRSYPQAMKAYRKDRRQRIAEENERELRRLTRDAAKDVEQGIARP